jgi:hypothetical protein
VSPLGTSATVVLLYLPQMIDDDYGAVGGMRIGRGNRSTRRKPATVPLCPRQISHDLTWDRTRAAAVGSQRLTAWAMERPLKLFAIVLIIRLNTHYINTIYILIKRLWCWIQRELRCGDYGVLCDMVGGGLYGLPWIRTSAEESHANYIAPNTGPVNIAGLIWTIMNIGFFEDVACSSVDKDQRFGWTSWLHLQGSLKT